MPANAQGLRIGISGSYGGVNLGDEAILHSIVDQLRSSLPVREIVVFSRDPRDTLARHAVDRALAMREMTREESRAEVQQLDLLILGGGGILYDKGVEVYLREVAGVAAAFAARTGKGVRDLPVNAVQDELLRQGANLGGYALSG